MLSNRNDPIFEEPAEIVNPNAHDRTHAFSSAHPNPARISHPNANLPPGAFDPRHGVREDTLPAGVPPDGPPPNSQEWQRQHGEGATVVTVEEKLPFKDQVKAWAKVHRGTVSLHYRILTEVSIIDHLSRFSGIMSKRSSVRRSWLEKYPLSDNHKTAAKNKRSVHQEWHWYIYLNSCVR